MRLFVFLLCVVSVCMGAAPVCAGEGLRLMIFTEEYPPYNYHGDNRVSGFSTDIVNDILEMIGSDVSRDEIRLVPWARAYDEVQNRKNSMVYSIVRTKDRDKLFKWVCPIACARIGVIARKEDRIRIRSLKDLEEYRIGVVREDVGHQLLEKVVDEKSFDISNSSEANLLKLKEGRIDVFIYDVNVVHFMLEKLGLQADHYETIYVLGELPFCIAFNKDSDEELVESFRNALECLLEEQNGVSCQ